MNADMPEFVIRMEQGHSCVYRIRASEAGEALAEARRRWDAGEFYVEGATYEPLATHARFEAP